ncbi:MAG: hypothetical protein HY904_20280 [Deltaproteobacteria bacterium]|nr:hypothetical protein [Deltaproteobacteria bacterium]
MSGWRVLGWVLALAAAAPVRGEVDGGADEGLPRCAEHHALRRQVQLMRVEAGKPRDWHERDRADRLRAELKALEAVLADVEEVYVLKLEVCRTMWLKAPRDPDVPGVNPGYYSCLASPPVGDDVVRAVRRRHEVERRLKDKGLDRPVREALRAELHDLQARLDEEKGMLPLHFRGDKSVDGGLAPVR